MLSSKIAVLIAVASIAVVAHLEEESVRKLDESFFEADVPRGYFGRTDLSDCNGRFHHRFVQSKCLVFNGVRVNATEFPHMAVIGWPSSGEDDSPKWKCGGSLITRRFVLTAAHCAVDDKSVTPTVVRLGDVDLATDSDDQFAQQFSIRRFIRHPGHRFSAKYNDIALIELDGEVILTPGVCPACVWNENHFPYDTFVTAGFGATGFGEPGSPHLLKAFLQRVSDANCSEAFEETTRGLFEGIADDQLCAASLNQDSCQGDSGGPLQTTLYTYKGKVATLVGLTSFGRGCGYGSFGVYQLIQPYIEWISSIVGESLDIVECAKQYESFLEINRLEPECEVGDPYISRVQLIWNNTIQEQKPKCSGTLIDYNTVVTTASCTLDNLGREPTAISIAGHTVPITQVQRHPAFQAGSLKDDIALIRLQLYLKINPIIAPACPADPSTQFATTSLRIEMKSNEPKKQLFLQSKQQCDNNLRLTNNITDESLDCWSTDYNMLPGLCEIDQGGPLLNFGHTELYGVNVYAKHCGSYSPLITIKLTPYRDWINAFVLDRSVTPEPPIAFPVDEQQEPMLLKPCVTKYGVEGRCMHAIACLMEIQRQRANKSSATLCGFEDGADYVCCPEDDIGKLPQFRPLPTLPVLPILPLIEEIELTD